MSNFSDFDFNNKRALIRVDFNVPLNSDFQVTDATRIKAALPTIQHILANGGSVVLMSHLGRPKNGPQHEFSLEHIVAELNQQLGLSVKFVGDCIGEAAFEATSAAKPGEVYLLENLRFYGEETKGDVDFAKKLAQHGDIYVNDAFGTAHRAHASTTIVAQFFTEKTFGLLMEAEIKSLDKVLKDNEKPFTAIIGGAKVSSKITIIENLLSIANNIIIGGGMAFTFAKAMGGTVGKSLVEDDYLQTALDVLEKAKAKGVQIVLPTDVVAADAFSNDANTSVVSANAIPSDLMGLDVGPESRKACTEVLLNSKTILWNGPMGVFEMPNFAVGTQSICDAVVQATSNGAFSLVGGGDSVAAVNQMNASDKVSYVSTGGGAMLEYLEGTVLPGVAAIRE